MIDFPVDGVAVVVIGRNEGQRLLRCLDSALKDTRQVVYVDSASTDGSATAARARGVDVVDLDMSLPFSAARARNAGFERVRVAYPGATLVQFVDGDCEIQSGWLELAVGTLRERADVAIVCGRRRERAPEASLYNRLCDVEWDTPPGEAEACGGDFMVRTGVFAECGGFNPTVIAGEEPELCYRIRRLGWRVLRVDHEMTLHDAAITRFGQWWTRATRSGYAYALVASLHWRDPGRFRVRNVLSIGAWGGGVPLLAALATLLAGPSGLLLLLLYPWLGVRIYRGLRNRRGLAADVAAPYAVACVIGKLAEFTGALRCARDLVLRRQRHIIEYKV